MQSKELRDVVASTISPGRLHRCVKSDAIMGREPGVTIAEYRYDGQGRRIAKIVRSASVTVGIPSDPAPKRGLP